MTPFQRPTLGMTSTVPPAAHDAPDTMAAPAAACPLCVADGPPPLWSDARWRVVRVDDAAFPAYYRVIAQSHVVEFSDLDEAERVQCMALVAAVERVLIEQLAPTKVNLAAFGNVVPHLHWHVIARFAWDSHFPQPVWGSAQRALEGEAVARLATSLETLDAHIAASLQGIGYTAPAPTPRSEST